MNLMDMIKDQVSGPLSSAATGFLGESESNVTSALGGIVPGLMGKIADVASDESGAQSILDMAGGLDAGMLDDIPGLLGSGGDAVNGLMNSGGGLVSKLFGGNEGNLISKIAGMSGMSSGNAGSLLKMATPLIMGLIGKQAVKGGLNASGLMNMLGGQKSLIQSMMPSGLSGALGFAKGMAGDAADAGKKVVSGAANVAGGAVDAGKKVVSGAANVAGGAVDAGKRVAEGAANVAGDAVDAGARAGKSVLRWLIPLFLVLLLAGLLFRFMGCGTGIDAIDNAAEKTVGMTENVVGGAADLAKKGAGAVADGAGAVAGAAGDVVGGAIDLTGDAFSWTADALGAVFNKVDDAAKGTWDKMKVASGSAGDQIKKFVDGGFKGEPNFTLKNNNFAVGSAELSGQSKGELKSVVQFMKAYPGTKIAVMGHTDNTGDEAKNLELSKARANSVKTYLVGGGVDGARIVSEGYGQSNPMVANDTPENQAKNRRIELRLMK